jgi:hypothetical protein
MSSDPASEGVGQGAPEATPEHELAIGPYNESVSPAATTHTHASKQEHRESRPKAEWALTTRQIVWV